jgi:hypothetical protein
MTIQEAIKSGKPFIRGQFYASLFVDTELNGLIMANILPKPEPAIFTAEDLIADDWRITK